MPIRLAPTLQCPSHKRLDATICIAGCARKYWAKATFNAKVSAGHLLTIHLPDWCS